MTYSSQLQSPPDKGFLKASRTLLPIFKYHERSVNINWGNDHNSKQQLLACLTTAFMQFVTSTRLNSSMKNINGKSRDFTQMQRQITLRQLFEGCASKMSKTTERRQQRCLSYSELSYKYTYTLIGQQTVLAEREYHHESSTGFLNEDDFKMLQQFSS